MLQHHAKGISSKHLIPQNPLNSITMSLACFRHHLFHSVVISKHTKWWWLPLGIYCKVQKKTEETLHTLHHSVLPLKREPRDILPLLSLHLLSKDNSAGGTANSPKGSHYSHGHPSDIITESDEPQIPAPVLRSTYVLIWMTSSSGKLKKAEIFKSTLQQARHPVAPSLS